MEAAATEAVWTDRRGGDRCCWPSRSRESREDEESEGRGPREEEDVGVKGGLVVAGAVDLRFSEEGAVDCECECECE